MTLIEARDRQGFRAYLERTENTICGRYPIAVFLETLEALCATGPSAAIQFLRYKQSSAVQSKRDSSVSYASAAVCIC